MALRMLEYGLQIAAQRAGRADGVWELELPRSAVVYLRGAPESLESRIVVPDGGAVTFSPKVICARGYTYHELADKRLYVLLPFYLMRYARRLDAIAGDPALRAGLLGECAAIYGLLSANPEIAGDERLYTGVMGAVAEVAGHLFRSHPDLGEEVVRVMGGEILELWTERAERQRREAAEQGLEQGLEQGVLQSLRNLMASTGCDADRAMRDLGVPDGEREKFAALLSR